MVTDFIHYRRAQTPSKDHEHEVNFVANIAVANGYRDFTGKRKKHDKTVGARILKLKQ